MAQVDTPSSESSVIKPEIESPSLADRMESEPAATAGNGSSSASKEANSQASGVHMPLLRENLLKTVNYCLLFSLVGMSDASLGAALPGLTCLARTTEQRITFLFLFHEMAVLLVTLLVGCLNRRNWFRVDSRCGRLGSNVLLSAVSLMMPACFLMVPQCRSLSSLAFAFSLMGLLEGCLEFFCNIQMLCMYRCHAGPFLQAMFFCQSLGAFISPLIIGAFMSTPQPHEWLNCTLQEESVSLSPDSTIAETAIYQTDDELEAILSRVRYPFYVIAAIQAPIMASMLVLTYKEAVMDVEQREELTEAKEEESHSISANAAIFWILALASVCAFALDGILGSYSSLIFAFAMRSVATRKDRGRTAYLPATFWGFTLLGRLSGVFFSLKVSSTGVLLVDMIGLLISALLFVLGQDNLALLFLATIGTGFFVSHCMPALLALTEQFICVTRDAAICLVASAAFGEAVLPVVMAAMMHRVSLPAFPISYGVFVLTACCLTSLYIGLGHRRLGGTADDPAARLFLGESPLDGISSDSDSASSAKVPLSPGRPHMPATNYGSQSQLQSR